MKERCKQMYIGGPEIAGAGWRSDGAAEHAKPEAPHRSTAQAPSTTRSTCDPDTRNVTHHNMTCNPCAVHECHSPVQNCNSLLPEPVQRVPLLDPSNNRCVIRSSTVHTNHYLRLKESNLATQFGESQVLSVCAFGYPP